MACSTCHMPYVREGVRKISDHQVRSPLSNVSRSCQVCHCASEEELKERIAIIKDRTHQLMDRALDAVVKLIAELEAAASPGTPESQLTATRHWQRWAQFRVDFVNAENSLGFHAQEEAARLLAEAIDFAQRGRLVLAKNSFSLALCSNFTAHK